MGWLGMLRILGLFPIVLVFLGCSARAPDALNNGRITNYTRCVLPKDQGKGSLHGQWGSLAVPLVLDRDFYVANDGQAVPSLRSSVQTWNSWASLRGFAGAFSLRNDGTGITAGRDIPELNDCAQASYSSSVSDMVGVWKISSAGFHRNRRDSCGTNADGSPGKILPGGVQAQTDWIIQNGRIIGASVLLNFEDYNSPGKDQLDVESLLLHELGHVLGLLHSCNGSSGSSIDSTTSPPCFVGNVLVAATQYANAVMFPFLRVNQERRDLRQNDLNRINCLY